jgi:glutamine cyclotransferase
MVFGSCSDNSNNSGSTNSESIPTTPIINYAVTHYFAHDTSLFTEGLLFHNGQLFESTGSPDELPQTKSVVGISDLETGKFNTKIEIDKSKFFGEGIVFLNNKLYQLTYKNQVGFIYDAKTFKQIGQFKYSNKEGWSLTTDGTYLIMSDGTNNLTYLDPVNFSPIKTLSVTEKGYPVDKLNELECIKGFIYANIWMSDFIVKIDPDEFHASVPLIGCYDALKFIFDFYKRPSFQKLTDSTAIILENHFKMVSERMGYKVLPSESDLAGLAWRSRVMEKNFDRAFTFLQLYIRLYSESPTAYDNMGQFYEAKGDIGKAKTFYEKAKQLRGQK